MDTTHDIIPGRFDLPVSRWDGVSTYDHGSGRFTLGLDSDGAPATWQLHEDGRLYGGEITGDVASGKTVTLNVAAAETALASDRDGRVCAVIMCDPLMASLPEWRGAADVTAWGAAACTRALRMLAAVTAERAAGADAGGFTLASGTPGLVAFVDDWDYLAAVREEAGAYLATIMACGRKTGVAVVRTSLVDIPPWRTSRGLNLVRHRSSYLFGGSSGGAAIPAGRPGTGYIQPDAVFRVKLPEPGSWRGRGALRAVTTRIAAAPVTFDLAAHRALTAHGYTGPGQVLDD